MSELIPEADATTAAEEVLEELTKVELEDHVIEVPGGIIGLLYRVRVGIESVSKATGVIAWILIWAVFVLGVFNVTTRYSARFIERDIIVGQIFDLQWMLFGALVLLGLNYGVLVGVNPRIDFWWAKFPRKKKAIIDLVLHTVLFLPFLVMTVRVLYGWALTSLGRSFDGTWATWQLWEIWEQSTDAGGLPRGPIKLAILVGFGLMGTQVFAEIVKQVLVLAGREDLAGGVTGDAPLRVE